jgi:hypothetical protein
MEKFLAVTALLGFGALWLVHDQHEKAKVADKVLSDTNRKEFVRGMRITCVRLADNMTEITKCQELYGDKQ